jgi:hypothetical protein
MRRAVLFTVLCLWLQKYGQNVNLYPSIMYSIISNGIKQSLTWNFACFSKSLHGCQHGHLWSDISACANERILVHFDYKLSAPKCTSIQYKFSFVHFSGHDAMFCSSFASGTVRSYMGLQEVKCMFDEHELIVPSFCFQAPSPGDNSTRTPLETPRYVQVVIYDHITRRKT